MLVALASLALAACGGSSADDAATGDPPTPTPVPADAPVPAPTDPPSGAPTEAPAGSDPVPGPADDAPAEEPPPAPPTGEPTEPPPAEPAAPPEVLWPDDGCSADNSPAPAAAADGPAPTVEVRPESADSPLPDLAVRRINCKGGWENLRNELPADRPLLVWFWAPH